MGEPGLAQLLLVGSQKFINFRLTSLSANRNAPYGNKMRKDERLSPIIEFPDLSLWSYMRPFYVANWNLNWIT